MLIKWLSQLHYDAS